MRRTAHAGRARMRVASSAHAGSERATSGKKGRGLIEFATLFTTFEENMCWTSSAVVSPLKGGRGAGARRPPPGVPDGPAADCVGAGSGPSGAGHRRRRKSSAAIEMGARGHATAAGQDREAFGATAELHAQGCIVTSISHTTYNYCVYAHTHTHTHAFFAGAEGT